MERYLQCIHLKTCFVVVKHTEILDAYEDHKKSFDGEDDEEDLSLSTNEILNNANLSPYLYNWKVCGFSIFSVKFKKELTDKYITKILKVVMEGLQIIHKLHIYGH